MRENRVRAYGTGAVVEDTLILQYSLHTCNMVEFGLFCMHSSLLHALIHPFEVRSRAASLLCDCAIIPVWYCPFIRKFSVSAMQRKAKTSSQKIQFFIQSGVKIVNRL